MTEKEQEHQAMRNLLAKKQIRIDELTKEVKNLQVIVQNKDLQITKLKSSIKVIDHTYGNPAEKELTIATNWFKCDTEACSKSSKAYRRNGNSTVNTMNLKIR